MNEITKEGRRGEYSRRADDRVPPSLILSRRGFLGALAAAVALPRLPEPAPAKLVANVFGPGGPPLKEADVLCFLYGGRAIPFKIDADLPAREINGLSWRIYREHRRRFGWTS